MSVAAVTDHACLTAAVPGLWRSPVVPLVLPANEVHVWRAALDLPAAQLNCLYDTLSPEERIRAARLHFVRDQDHFIATRGALRQILAGYLKPPPAQLRFCSGRFGKPALDSNCGADDLRFNLSHSDGLALFAVARTREVGIDVERVDPRTECERLAEQLFSPQEAHNLSALPRTARREAFFLSWTGTEAYLKARGEGLVGSDAFDSSVAQREAACASRAGNSRWSLLPLRPAPGYVANVAAEGDDWGVRLWQWVKCV